MDKEKRSERDGRDIIRRLDSDELMSPTSEMYRELPLSTFGDRAERYHKIMMARTRTYMLMMTQLSQQRGIDLERALEKQRWERSPESDLGALVGLKHGAVEDLEQIKLKIIAAPKRLVFPLNVSTAADPGDSTEGPTANNLQDRVVQYKEVGYGEMYSGSVNTTNGNKKTKQSWKKRFLGVFSWCRGSTKGKED